MQVDRSLHVCLVGEAGIGQTAFLQCFRGEASGNEDRLERFVTLAELDGQPFCVRFTDTAGNPCFDSMWHAVLGSAHAILLCYAVDREDSLQALQEKWLPLLWSSRSEAPVFIVGLRADLRSKVSQKIPCVPEAVGFEFAQRTGAICYLECSAFEPESVQASIDQILLVAREFYTLQWQLGPRHDSSAPPVDDSAADAPWLMHEKLNVAEDPAAVDVETVRKNLSMLGATSTAQHAYLRLDLADMSLTSVDAIRSFQHLQFINISGNRLRTLEPFGALRCLLHLNASFNLLIRTQGFTAPDQLETVDMSYNLISELGEWGVHKYLRELNLRGNYIENIRPGLTRNRELRMLDLSENHISRIENLEGLGLHTLYLAQNRLTSLEGIGSLKKLQVLNVRHNGITSIGALRAEDIPRMRKLCISENRVSHIEELKGLQDFAFLCDFLLAPNPVEELPHYREQVLHRLPDLRLLDGQHVTAEEKVKAAVIYGSDVDQRREIFDSQLPKSADFPKETFVDRRLITEEGIANMEVSQFGQQGYAGEYGSTVDVEQLDASGEPLPRTRFQEAQFRQRLEIARRGGDPEQVADFATSAAPFLKVTVFEEDIPEILEVCAEGGIHQLLLGTSAIGFRAAGIMELLIALQAAGPLCHVDLSGCPAVKVVVGELLQQLPYERGCSIEASGTGISEADVTKLRNQTPEAEAALRHAADERQRDAEMCAAYLSRQEALEDFAAENKMQETPPEILMPLHHPSQWREGIEVRALTMHKEYMKKNPNGVQDEKGGMSMSCMNANGNKVNLSQDEIAVLDQQRRLILSERGYSEAEEGGEVLSRPLPASFEKAFAPVLSSPNLLGFMVWNGVKPNKDEVQEKARQREEQEKMWKERMDNFMVLTEAAAQIYDASPSRPANVASAQLIAHLTYHCLNCTLNGNDALKPLTRFGLKWLAKTNQWRPKPRHGQDLHAALNQGKVAIESVVGRGFGLDSLEIGLRSNSSEDITVTVQKGTIFQHLNWEHRQNLIVALDYVITLPAKSMVTKKMMAHCMNSTCACSNGNHPMSLTEFYLDDSAVLANQATVWDYFEECFSKED